MFSYFSADPNYDIHIRELRIPPNYQKWNREVSLSLPDCLGNQADRRGAMLVENQP
jgi:hypothetical protein